MIYLPHADTNDLSCWSAVKQQHSLSLSLSPQWFWFSLALTGLACELSTWSKEMRVSDCQAHSVLPLSCHGGKKATADGNRGAFQPQPRRVTCEISRGDQCLEQDAVHLTKKHPPTSFCLFIMLSQIAAHYWQNNDTRKSHKLWDWGRRCAGQILAYKHSANTLNILV